ncbi:MAG UNVERIFIED_CONTAM: hypothetical protein LVR18_48605 [Planctomycetaceae bacterium]
MAQVSNARLGAAPYRTSGGNSYAIAPAGTASLVGIDGLTLSGTLAARINTTGGAVDETIEVPGGAPVNVSFTAGRGRRGLQRHRHCRCGWFRFAVRWFFDLEVKRPPEDRGSGSHGFCGCR